MGGKITLANLKDEEKLSHVRHELNTLEYSLSQKNIEIPKELFDKLKDINQTLWDTEDIIREREKSNNFDDEFVKHARLDAKLNDQRFLVKNEINNFYDSNIKEQKSYDGLY